MEGNGLVALLVLYSIVGHLLPRHGTGLCTLSTVTLFAPIGVDMWLSQIGQRAVRTALKDGHNIQENVCYELLVTIPLVNVHGVTVGLLVDMPGAAYRALMAPSGTLANAICFPRRTLYVTCPHVRPVPSLD